jgi:transposase
MLYLTGRFRRGTEGQEGVSERVHRCGACGMELERNGNTALNILAAPRGSNFRAWVLIRRGPLLEAGDRFTARC